MSQYSHLDTEDDLQSLSTQPLIANPDVLLDPTENVDNPEDGAITGWIWLLTLTAGISGLLFGYDTASISAALLHLGPSLSTPEKPVTTWDKSLITSSTSLGALVGGLFAGLLADRIGRRGVIWVADVLFILGALWQALAGSVGSMVIGRAVVGLGVGVGSLIVPLYISELSPPSHRGRLVVINVLFITFGQLIAYAVGLILSPPTLSQDLSWRFMLGLGGVPACFQFVFMFFMPETPRWLVQHSRHDEAAKVVRKVYGDLSETSVEKVLGGIEQGVETVSKDPFMAKLRAIFVVGSNRRALAISCLLQGLQQACGFNSLMYYSATIFSLVGFKNPTATAMVVAGTNLVFTALAFTLIDRIGRRRILLWSIPGMIVGLLLCAIAFHHLPILTTTAASELSPSIWTPLLIIFMMAYVAAYAIGVGAIPWIVQSEFFPMRVRGLGTGMATATNWVLNFVVGATFLPAVEWMWGGAEGLFVVYAMVCGGGLLAVYSIYPETRGLRMEEIESVLRNGWGVNRETKRGPGEDDI
ncbi:general substrate transporter [Morchella snyderi]|nr:general substrate transporter [Morchella snyderi]